jgi:hypothetical protein
MLYVDECINGKIGDENANIAWNLTILFISAFVCRLLQAHSHFDALQSNSKLAAFNQLVVSKATRTFNIHTVVEDDE